MPNWKKVVVSGSDALLNSVTASFTGSLTGALIGTASWAVSASQALTASYSRNLQISGSINNVNYIDFNTGSTIGTNEPAWKEGRVFYDSGSGALAVYNWEQDVTLNVGQESWLRARNQTGVTITNGTVVRLLGAIGDRPTITPAQATDQTNTFSTDNEIIGMATHDIETGTDGFVTTFGMVNGVNTAAFTAGDLLWVSQSAGKFTNVPPPPPIDKTFVGIVTRANVSNGSIFITPNSPIHFHDISTVSASVYQMGDLWMYRSGSVGQANAWINTKALTGSYGISGSLNVNGSITGSLFGTASWATNATNTVSASFASTASFVNPLRQNVTISGSLLVSSSIVGSGSTYNTTIDLQSATISINGTASIAYGVKYLFDDKNVRSIVWDARQLLDNSQSLSVNYNSRTLNSGSTTVLDWSSGTGSLIGSLIGISSTSSVSEATATVRNTNNAVFYPTFVDSNNSTKAYELIYTAPTITFNPGTATLGASNISASSIFAGGITGSLLGTASYATQALSASYAPGGGAAFPYTGSALITGSLGVTGSTSIRGTLNQGSASLASGLFSHVQGLSNTASGIYSHAEGAENKATGSYSHAEGYGTITTGSYSHAEGNVTITSGSYSHAEGFTTIAIGNNSHAEGESTKTGTAAAYSASVLFGEVTLDSGYGDVSAEFVIDNNLLLYDQPFDANYGKTTFIIFDAYFSSPNTIVQLVDTSVTTTTAYVGDLGYGIANWTGNVTIPGDNSHVEGREVIAIGNNSHAEGYLTTAIGGVSHAEGESTQAIGDASHAEGSATQAIGTYSHAEGNGAQAYGSYSHAEGRDTIATGQNSHAEGRATNAVGTGAHAEGNSTQASGEYSHAEGISTVALGNYQHVQGQYNLSSSAQSAFIIGNGTSTSARSNLVFASGSQFQITGSLLVTGSTVITGSVRGNVTALTITSNTASVNLLNGNFFTLNLVGGANTHINPTNINPGQTANIRISQSSAGTGTVSFPTFVDQPSGSLYTGSQVANAMDIISLVTFDSNLVYVSSVRNLV